MPSFTNTHTQSSLSVSVKACAELHNSPYKQMSSHLELAALTLTSLDYRERERERGMRERKTDRETKRDGDRERGVG